MDDSHRITKELIAILYRHIFDIDGILGAIHEFILHDVDAIVLDVAQVEGDLSKPENTNPDGGPSTGSAQAQNHSNPSDDQTQNQTPQNRQYSLTVNSDDINKGTVTGGGTFTEGSTVNISASAKAGYQFEKWSDGITTANRSVKVTSDMTLTASFKEVTQSGGSGDDEGGVGEY